MFLHLEGDWLVIEVACVGRANILMKRDAKSGALSFHYNDELCGCEKFYL